MSVRKLSISKLLQWRHHTPYPAHRIITSLISNHPIQSHHYTKYHHHRYDVDRFYKFSFNRSFSSEREKPISTDDFFDNYESVGDTTSTISSEITTATTAAAAAAVGGAILPVRCLVWFLDQLHSLTGMPWWIVIIISTLTLRVAILPVLVVQLRKLMKNAQLAPKLPPPLPPPFSGKSWIKHFRHFREKRIQLGCPSFLWILAYPSVQIPCFILGTATVREMALNHHSGFESGGTLWFQNLTELSHGASGFIFPLLLASLHLLNVQLSFERASLKMLPNSIGVLAKYYRFYLQSLTIPILFAGFYLPQGSLVYWAANSSITLVQQLAMKHPHVREKLGLPDKSGERSHAPVDSGKSHELDGLEASFTVPMVKKSIQELSLLELFNLSIKHLSKGEQDRAVPLLRLALEKDPEYVRALIVMGQILMKDEKLVEATEYLERAVNKILLIGHPTEVEEIDHLILASLWSGVALAKQGKVTEGIVHLERIANMKEPEDPKSKTHYCDGLFMLSSSLASVGLNIEAAKYLRILTTYDPAYGEYLKDLETEDNNFANDLENSRRKDY